MGIWLLLSYTDVMTLHVDEFWDLDTKRGACVNFAFAYHESAYSVHTQSFMLGGPGLGSLLWLSLLDARTTRRNIKT